MPPGTGELFIAEVDRDAWRRPLVPWVVGGAVVTLTGLALLLVGWFGIVVALAGACVVAAKVGGYVARRKRRSSPLMIDLDGVTLPTAQGPALLPWDTLRAVVVDGPTLRFRVRPSVTPATPGVTGLHRRDAWPVASGPGLPLDTRLFTRDRDEIITALRDYSHGSLRIS
ncbi:hypothetical protein [Actinokineospora globicatena]|uniref:PH domain-containing protein n=1 Tax=Actinokineospora globicatena TaxID=103729 RepID=A0A9W6QGY1_9PSEU|nr:hypothetical protein [Actinokineospora globicatena]MCP2303250.1 hypothetical protein [Actinokineospora globicatena]GLW79622.1 hypothetical protein Aglo01_41030 [Actinokineospora globicatena]GLW85968.1 hypothetical protein Aglo02_36080 [Actinokineospora globicatena]GLW90233.1 hypothetical protein Aglo03_10490 [Actinokineospora globicatena]